MKRLKLLAAVALLGIPLAACEESTPPPPVGSIGGQVSIEGTGIDGVSVNLSNGQTQTTSGGGNYRFDNVEGGAYTVTISGYPSDATFDATSQAATIASADQSVTLNFSGSYIRTASVMGTVTVESAGLGGVSVRISGVSDATAITDAAGRYSFTGLRMGSYSVEISGFDSDAVGFSSTASSVSVGVGESKIVSFDGTYLRTAGVSGQVSVEGDPLEGVMVSLRGGPDNVDQSTSTDAAGQYAFSSLRAGTYTVGISGYDDTDYEFEVTSKSVTVALGETGYVEFEGELLRTSGLAGRVSVGGMGLPGVTVTISGAGDGTTNTDASGIYAFAGLAAGAYTVTISGYDAVEYSFDDSQDVTLEMDKTAIVNFDGMALRTASIQVTVTADGAGVAGVQAQLTLVTGATSGTILSAGMTDADGMHTFGPLLAGSYIVDISGADAEIDFATTVLPLTVATGAMAEANFPGMINRTGSIAGMVTVDGEGMGGVDVTLSGGDGDDMMAETGDDGSYSFGGLRRGDYTVSIANPNADMYSFASTSRSVSVAIGQAHSDVSFAGAMIRRSSISGQVSVEGVGLAGVAVTLSGAHAATDSTDASGQYAFAGLGAGMYTVSIANPNEVAYAFEATSASVELGNSGSATQNFAGMHTRTASISGMLYVDEADNNDMHDDGEAMLEAAGVELALIGPSIAERQTGSTGDDGSFSFDGLRAGSYQLQVAANAMIPDDYAYGGPATGYDVMVAAGEAASQNIPFDITHTTVNFSVTLKSGDARGAALPGAMVTLYADDDGDDMVGEGETDEMGMTSIRVAREGTSDNMVHAMVASDDYAADGDMQAVTWEATSTTTDAMNDGDIVNLNVDVTVSGATVMTEYGGGKALAGWAISVMMGDKAVEGAPAKLDDDGMASFKTTVESVPAAFTFAVAKDQAGTLDGGEKYMGTDVKYMHDGLSLMGKMDAGTMEVTYTTQTLKVYVHHEMDQVMGYSGNILGGDERMSGVINVNIRHIDANGRSRSYPSTAKIRAANKDGVYTFGNVPAGDNVIVQASKANAAAKVMLLDPDELATYRDLEENGVMGGAFGEMGGFHHTVWLCPMSSEEHRQGVAANDNECGSFAYVSTYSVSGLVWKKGVSKSGDDFAEKDPVFVAGQTVSLDPVADKNLAGESHSQTTTAKNVAATKNRDDTHQFNFGNIAAGVYEISVPAGWRARLGGKGSEGSATAVRDALNPLNSDIAIDVTPTTATVYGRVNGGDGFPLDSVTVTANGVSAMTDAEGRYILEGIAPATRKIGTTTHKNMIFLQASRAGHDDSDVEVVAFAANSVTREDIDLSGTAETATVSGTVVAFGSTTPVGGVEIRVDGNAPVNKNAKSKGATKNNIYVTAANGSYSIRVPAKMTGNSRISAHKDGYTFTPAHFDLSTPKGTSISGIGFQAVANSTIRGRVKAPEGGPLAGVEVSAMLGDNVIDMDSTGVTGTYSLSVPAGTYDMSGTKEGYTINAPESGSSVTVGLGQTVSFDDFTSTKDAAPPTPKSTDATLSALSVSPGTLDPAFSSADTAYTVDVGETVDTVTVMAEATHDSANVAFSGTDADTAAAGHQVVLANAGDTARITVTVTAEDDSTMMRYRVTVARDDGRDEPSAPRNLKVESGDQSATLTWTAPRQFGSSAITGYDWEASAPGQLTRSGSTSTANDDGVFTQAIASLVNGAEYTFSVYAVNGEGRGPAATVMGKAMPAITLSIAPTTLTEEVETPTDDSATAAVSISSPSIEDISITVYEMVDDDNGAQVTITGATIVIPSGQTAGPDSATIRAINDVVNDDAVGAEIRVRSTGATLPDSVDITITDDDTAPSAPTSVAAEVGDKQLRVNWTAAAPGSSAVTHFQIRYTIGSLDDDDKWMTVPGGAGARTHLITGLTNGEAYSIEVRAVSAAGPGAAESTTGTPTG